MTALKAHEVGRYLLRPDLEEGIFLVYGPDAGLVRETAATLARHYAGNDSSGLVTLEATDVDADPSIVAMEARSLSLFGGRRVVRVRGGGKSLVMTLSDLRDDPAGAIVIIEAGNLTPKDPIRALVEAARNGRAMPCYPDTDETLSALINDTFNREQIRIDADTVAILRETLGNDREITRRELEKLVLFAAKSKELTRDDVLVLCADSGALAIDAVLDATGTGHAEKLDSALSRALASAVDPQRILAMTAGHFATLRRWRVEVDAGKSARDVLGSARPRPHFSRSQQLEQQLRLWTDTSLATALDRLHNATQESRRRPALAESLLRRTLLSLATSAARH